MTSALGAEDLGQPTWFVALDEDPQWRSALESLFCGDADLRLAGACEQPEDAVRLLRDNGADLLLVSRLVCRGTGLESASELARRLPEVRVYLTDPSPTRETWEEARRLGLHGVLKKPFDAQILGHRLREDREMAARSTEGLRSPLDTPASGPAPCPVPPVTLAVFSFKGGVGKSLVAVSLAEAAVASTARHRRSCVLVDAEEGVGSVATLLGVAPRPNLLDWDEYRGERHVDPAIALRKLAATRSGLHCLFAPGEADLAPDPELLETVLLTLSRMFSLVVADCGAQVSAGVHRVLQLSTLVLVVVEPSLDCLDRVRRGCAALAASGLPLNKFRVLVNRAHPGAGDFSPAEVRQALGLPILGALPFDPAAKRAANRRRSLASEAPHGLLMTALTHALEAQLPGLAEAGTRPWAPRWRRRP